MASSSNLICKIELDGDIRRFKLDTPSFSEVMGIAERLFALPKPITHRLVCKDQDNHQTPITDDHSLQKAIHRSNSVLRLALVVPPPQPAIRRCLAPRILCDGCNTVISLEETRFNCEDCFDFDLCAACESKGDHDPSHVLRKMRPEARRPRPIAIRHLRPAGFHPSPLASPIILPFQLVAPQILRRAAPFPRCRAGAPSQPCQGHPAKDAPAAPNEEISPRAAIDKLLQEQVFPRVLSNPAFAAIPVKDIAGELLDTLEAECPNILKPVQSIMAHFLEGKPMDFTLLLNLPNITPELLTKLQNIIESHFVGFDFNLNDGSALLDTLIKVFQ